MMTFIESKENLEGCEECLDSQLWHACAGSLVQLPTVNTKVFYFPQGHSEHVSGNVDFRNCPRVPSYIPCHVSAVKFMADPETDEPFARIRLVPFSGHELDFDDGGIVGVNGVEDHPISFAKTLTQSDANNGGGFSVPRYCADTIFPRLDYSADPPVQSIVAKDVHGKTWNFRHIFRGTPRRHLLTTGWSSFVNKKKLVAGDSIVFMRAENGELCLGIRRAKRGIGCNPEMARWWNPPGGFSAFLQEGENKSTTNNDGYAHGSWSSRGRVKANDVIEAVTRAMSGQSFDVVYYPRDSPPEFCVKASLVKAAMQIHWCSGMRFKMPFETEDSSRISWFAGTTSSVQAVDPIRWPNSPWRMIQVTWDEPDVLQNVNRVSPWLVELAPNMPMIHFSPFSHPHKKLRLPMHPDIPLGQKIPLPVFSSTPFGCLRNDPPAGMQGARHAQYNLSLSNINLNKLHSDLPCPRVSVTSSAPNNSISNEKVSCLLNIGKSSPNSNNGAFVLFGQQISISPSCSDGSTKELSLDTTSHCKVFMESEDVGRTLDLSSLCSYDELHRALENMFNIEITEMRDRVIYRDATGAVRQLGDAPYINFSKIARRLTIRGDPAASNGSV